MPYEVWHLEGKWDAIFCAHVTIVTSATRTVFLSLSHSSAGERVSGKWIVLLRGFCDISTIISPSSIIR